MRRKEGKRERGEREEETKKIDKREVGKVEEKDGKRKKRNAKVLGGEKG